MRAFLTGLFLPFVALATPVPPPGMPDLVESVLPGVVNISSTQVTQYSVHGMDEFLRMWGIPQERRSTSLGSGFILDQEGFVVTNHHVVAQADEVIVTTLDKKRYRARLIGGDEKLDLALLQLRDPKTRQVPPGLKPLPLADSDRVRIAEPVFAVGNPFGLQHTVTMGIISAKNRTIGQGPLDNFLQTDASINPGNSGGPLFNTRGEVIGVNTVIFSRTGQSGGLGFAIPANDVRSAIADLKRYGRIPRPWLGILGETVSPPLAGYYNLPTDDGVLVHKLVRAAPAVRVGVKAGDVIVAVDGEATPDMITLERTILKRKPGEKIRVKVLRGAGSKEISVELKDHPPLDNLPKGIL